MSSSPPASLGGRPPRSRAAVVLVLLSGLAAVAADSPGAGGGLSADTRLLWKVRHVLAEDEPFAALNLGVQIRGGVATLWGTVPAADVGRRAVERVRQVPGVKEVRSELSVTPPDPVTAEPAAPPSQGPALAPGALADRPLAHTAVPASPALAGTGRQISPRPAPETAVSLLPPLPAEAPTGLPRDPPLPPAPARDLAREVDRLRQRDSRFRGIRAEVREGSVFLRGTVVRPEDAMEMARAVSVLPGVQSVIILRIQVQRAAAPR
jgi:osmotically-inducible protein OsmY